jgi:hypothetical protein
MRINPTKSMMILIAFLLGGFLIPGCAPNGNHIGIQGNDLFYTPAVSSEEAHTIADYLVQTEFFANGQKSVQLDNVEGVPYFRLVVKEGFTLDSANRSTLRAYGRLLHEDLYKNNPFIFHICDKNFRTLHAFSFKK